MRFPWALVGIAAVTACQPDTTRPPFQPVPQSATTEVRLPAPDAARLFAEALRAGSIPATRLSLRDTWLETGWFDPTTGKQTKHRPIGPKVVRVRGWADPTRPGSSKLFVETVYRPVEDPSLPERELDRQVPRNHPVAIKVRAALQDLVKRYGGPPPPVTAEPRAAPSEEPDAEQVPMDEGAGAPEEPSPAPPPP
jgi:hypothetical protein